MVLLAFIVVLVGVPLVELYVIYKVGDAIGVVPTLLILAADSLLGAWLMKSQGRTVWRRFNEAVGAGTIPHREIIDGVLVIFGGAFLITPGFVTDIVGICLLLPPTRSLIRRLLQARLARRAMAAAGEFGTRRTRPRQDYDVEGTATEYDAGVPRRANDPPRRRLER